jgi:hypothetical protein
VRSINITVARLRDDVSRLELFQNDSAQVQQQKLDLVRQDDQQRRQIWKNGVDESRNSTVNSASRSSSSPSSGIPFESHAYRQAVQIHLSGNWQN